MSASSSALAEPRVSCRLQCIIFGLVCFVVLAVLIGVGAVMYERPTLTEGFTDIQFV